jgi:hypothetical protein
MVERWEGERRDKIGAAAILVAGVALLFVAGWEIPRLLRGTTQAELDRRIEQTLPKGSQKTDVLKYIDSQKWQIQAADSHVLVARFHDSLWEGLLPGKSFRMRFQFDDGGRLISYSSTQRRDPK